MSTHGLDATLNGKGTQSVPAKNRTHVSRLTATRRNN